MAEDSTVGHGEPLAEFMDRAMTMPWCSKCGRPTLGMKESAIEILRLRAELAECKRDAERYRWLIAHWDRIGVRVEYADGERHVVEINLLDPRKYPLNEESLVQAIDAARKGEETQ